MRVQFICKKNEIYSFVSYCRRSSGLFNSTRFIVESLTDAEIECEIIEVNDNNDIDREVTRYKPDVVIIEAFWVVPEKFDVLKKLHPKVNWYCHLHSGIVFLSIEGIATQWLSEYAKRGIGIIANSPETYKTYEILVEPKGRRLGPNHAPATLTYLPNVYLSNPRPVVKRSPESEPLRIGCFGAIRPLKNQLIQAFAAIRFAREKGRKLEFYINATRVETGGDPVRKNLVQLFNETPDAKLVMCDWQEHDDFLNTLMKMDMGLQLSLTETFNIVAADYITAGIPVVVSDDVKWVSWLSKAKDDSVDDIVRKMHRAYDYRVLVKLNQRNLLDYSEVAQRMWLDFILNKA